MKLVYDAVVVVGLMILQLHTARMGMGHGKLGRKQSQELSMLRAKLKSHNDDYDNLMIAEYTPLRLPTNAPRFKIIDNQQQTRNPLVGTPKWKKHREHNTNSTATKDIRNTEYTNWRLELPEVSKPWKKETDHQNTWRLDSLNDEAARVHKKQDYKNTLRTMEPVVNVVEKKAKHDNNLSMDSGSNDTETDYSESIETTRVWNKKIDNQDTFPTLNAEVFDATTVQTNPGVTRVRKKPDYKHTWRTWEPEVNNDTSISKKPEYQVAGRMDLDDNDTESNEATEDWEKDAEFENTLRLDSVSDSDVIDDTKRLKKNTDHQNTVPTTNAGVSEVTSIFNKQTDYNTWHTWKHFTNYSTATRFPDNVKSAGTKATRPKAPEYEEYRYWKNSREGQTRAKITAPTMRYPNEKLGAMHLRIGSEESDFLR